MDLSETLDRDLGRGSLATLMLVLALPACGGAVGSGVALGKVGNSLASHGDTVPQGAEVCALKVAVAGPQPGEKPVSETCAKAVKSDRVWRGAIVTLGAYSDTLGTIAAGDATDTTGQLEAALTGVDGPDWTEAEEGSETAARDAVAKLVDEIRGAGAKDDLAKTIQDAAPHVNTLCEGLDEYLDAQAQGFVEVLADAEKKRGTRTDRRCGTVDNKSLCVNDSPIDRVVYGHSFGQLTLLAQRHREARATVSAFCAAHEKLESAAKNGDLKSDETHAAVVAAVKAARREAAAASAAEPSAGSEGDKKEEKAAEPKSAAPEPAKP
jgi:hypothetical protein